MFNYFIYDSYDGVFNTWARQAKFLFTLKTTTVKILINETVIETSEIANIVDVEADKKMFLNREAGFKLIMIDGSVKIFSEQIPYESTPGRIQDIKQKWERKMNDVMKYWKQDKIDVVKI